MNLSNLVHDNRRYPSQQSPSPYSPRTQHASHSSPRVRHTYHRDMASVLVSNPYTSQPSVTSAYSHSPQPPPSPPVEDPNSKCTLPSIQSLIGMADSSPSTPIPSGAEWETQQIQHQSPVVGNEQGQEFRPYGYGQPGVSNPTHLPPTPPLRPNSGFDGSHQSPSTSSRSSYAGNAINNVEPHSQRQPQPSAIEPYPVARLPSQSPYANSPFVNSPSGASTYSYPSPANHPPTSGGLYYPRPLPAAYPPPELPVTLSNSHHSSPIDPTNTWQHQHHHYISPSSSAAFAGQSQDRYICQTCNKAFSRPSSLRIHSHSHTGEKPFKCQHEGCGKAFSVRSNMKRHERGCHGGGSPGSS